MASIPSHLKTNNVTVSTESPSFSIENNVFDVAGKRSKVYYYLLVSGKAKPPNIISKLQNDFNFTRDQIKQIFALPHLVALESYVKAFQYKVKNSILYTNTKLFKIGYKTDDLCTFCNAEPETLSHLFYDCSHSKNFCIDFESYWCFLSNQQISLSMRNILFGILEKKCPLSNLLDIIVTLN